METWREDLKIFLTTKGGGGGGGGASFEFQYLDSPLSNFP